ncbi:MAG: hypothetical protein ACK5DD_12945 [Cyclobacteriaceae bacterium]|jgi:hypothetical protein
METKEPKANKKKQKVSKKALRTLLTDSLVQSLDGLELPKANKKVKKVMTKASKALASTYARLIKKQMKQAKSKSKSKKPVADKANNGQVAVAA